MAGLGNIVESHQTIDQKVKIYMFDNSVTKRKGKILLYLGRGLERVITIQKGRDGQSAM